MRPSGCLNTTRAEGQGDWSTVRRDRPPDARAGQKRRENGPGDQMANKKQSGDRMIAQHSESRELAPSH